MQTQPHTITMDEIESLKAELAAAYRESEDLRLRLQNFVSLYRHEFEMKKGTVHHASDKLLTKTSFLAPTAKVYAL